MPEGGKGLPVPIGAVPTGLDDDTASISVELLGAKELLGK